MKEQILKHAPIAAAALASAVAVRLMMPTVSQPAKEATAPTPHAAPAAPTHPDIKTRLVSCGNSRHAAVSGPDEKGAIALGDGAKGRCTLLFGHPWAASPLCTIKDGTVARATPDEIEIETDLASVTYTCGEGR